MISTSTNEIFLQDVRSNQVRCNHLQASSYTSTINKQGQGFGYYSSPRVIAIADEIGVETAHTTTRRFSLCWLVSVFLTHIHSDLTTMDIALEASNQLDYSRFEVLSYDFHIHRANERATLSVSLIQMRIVLWYPLHTGEP